VLTSYKVAFQCPCRLVNPRICAAMEHISTHDHSQQIQSDPLSRHRVLDPKHPRRPLQAQPLTQECRLPEINATLVKPIVISRPQFIETPNWRMHKSHLLGHERDTKQRRHPSMEIPCLHLMIFQFTRPPEFKDAPKSIIFGPMSDPTSDVSAWTICLHRMTSIHKNAGIERRTKAIYFRPHE
jgi:hypothetical protein